VVSEGLDGSGRRVESAVKGRASYLRPGATVVLESVSYPGTTEEIVVPSLETGSGLVAGPDFPAAYSPERIDPGYSKWNFVNTLKIVSKLDPASLKAIQELYLSLVDTTVSTSSPKEAELAKLLENTFRHVNIALVNEIAIFAHQLGVDIWEAIDAATTNPSGLLRSTPRRN